MRERYRIWAEKYPSIAKIRDSIAGARRMGSESTVEHYIQAVIMFTEYAGYPEDPETLLKDMQSGKVNAEAKTDAFIDYALEDLGLSHSSVRHYVFGVKKWFALNGVKMNFAKIEMPTATATVERDRAPTKEELKTLLNHASSSRDRFAIFALSSSGLRIGTFLSLKIGDVDMSPPDVAIVRVEKAKGRKFSSKRARGAGRLFVTFFSPEAKKAMTQYLRERESVGERLTAQSPLITEYTYSGEFISKQAFSQVWNRLLKRAGLNEKSHIFHVLHLHTLRKYFRSNCVGVDASYREKWMGHKGLYLDESYFRAEESLHLAEYRKAVPHLAIYAQPTNMEKIRAQAMMDFAKIQGYDEEKLRKLEEVLARSKDVDEAIEEFRKFKEDASEAGVPEHTSTPKRNNGNGRYLVARGETELIRRLDEGANLIQNLNEDKYLLRL